MRRRSGTSATLALAALALLAGAGLGPLPARAADSTSAATPAPKPWNEELSLNAFVSTSWSYNFKKPASRTNAYRVFDFDDNSMKLDVMELVAQRAAQKPGDAGFRVDFTAGGSIPRVAASAGLFRDDSGRAGDVDVHQAYVTWVAPVGSGLKLDFGKFITGAGNEVIEGYDGWNDNATRSFLFGYAIPFTHTGARATYTFSPVATGMVGLVNGWDNTRDNNTGKTVMGQLVLTPVATAGFTANVIYGPEKNDFNEGARLLLDWTFTLKPTPKLALAANYDYGSEKDVTFPSGDPFELGVAGDVSWQGLAGYARCTLNEKFALIARGEVFKDTDGFRTGTAQTLTEFTLTPEYQATDHVVFRADLRFDHSDQPTFLDHADPSQSQATLLLNALFHF